jgi:ribosome-associated protein
MARYDSSVTDADTSDERVSKTRRKQEMHALQALGVALVGLPDAQLASMQLPDELAQAVRGARGIASREARRRQLQYIGRLMRDLDPEPIRARLEDIEGTSAAATARHRRMEQWRTRLLEDDGALTDFALDFPGADLQTLRTLIRNARREQKEGRPPRAFRELYRVLRAAEQE